MKFSENIDMIEFPLRKSNVKLDENIDMIEFPLRKSNVKLDEKDESKCVKCMLINYQCLLTASCIILIIIELLVQSFQSLMQDKSLRNKTFDLIELYVKQQLTDKEESTYNFTGLRNETMLI